jgi:flagellar basal-body rod protein FlgC
MSFLSSLDISASALSAQRTRMDIIAQNIANADTIKTEDGTPYRRQLVVFEEKNSFKSYLGESRKKARPAGVKIAAVIKDESPLTPVYDPTNPEADENGYIYMPNVDKTKETIDAMAASNSYNANITALNAIKAMASKALEIGK